MRLRKADKTERNRRASPATRKGGAVTKDRAVFVVLNERQQIIAMRLSFGAARSYLVRSCNPECRVHRALISVEENPYVRETPVPESPTPGSNADGP